MNAPLENAPPLEPEPDHQPTWVSPTRWGMPSAVADALRAPFPASQVGKLPRLTCKDCSQAQGKVCSQHRKQRCDECGNYISTAHIHLDYVGHAAVTDRLLAADPNWTWEPYATDEHGMPLLELRRDVSAPDEQVALWIKLTVGGITRPGFGGGKNVKEAIGDAIRNAAMRFGVALDLWHRDGDLFQAPDETPRVYDWRLPVAQVRERWGDETAEAFKAMAAEARAQTAHEDALWAVLRNAAATLVAMPGEFPPPNRAEMIDCFPGVMQITGPPWRMSPDETNRPPRDGAPSQAKGGDDATPATDEPAAEGSGGDSGGGDTDGDRGEPRPVDGDGA